MKLSKRILIKIKDTMENGMANSQNFKGYYILFCEELLSNNTFNNFIKK